MCVPCSHATRGVSGKRSRSRAEQRGRDNTLIVRASYEPSGSMGLPTRWRQPSTPDRRILIELANRFSADALQVSLLYWKQGPFRQLVM